MGSVDLDVRLVSKLVDSVTDLDARTGPEASFTDFDALTGFGPHLPDLNAHIDVDAP